ncbi:unnamed protein product [Triticum turgidum subsp. durum]|uniref:Protein kinase domain-containing protein n=1 Tax=Triticum turgidum subsp. durum TaxID=4567 RepID=A0A9R0SL75_TRITD|nr:unnamed protein product [Triticum turgidum subsp. durum]
MKVSTKEQQQQQRAAAEEEAMDLSAGGPGEEEEEAARPSGAGEGGTVVVGVRADAESRALLTWAFVNAVAAGDRVVAVHVVLASAAEAAAAVDFDGMLAVYEGFCNLKRINLKVKICKGSSVRKALVREATLFGASKLVLGITKRKRTIGSSLSVAKYCAKKLPAKCAVLAVNGGKIVYRRESNAHSGKVSADVPGCGDDEMYCVLPFGASQQGKEESELPCDEPSKDGDAADEEQHDVGAKGSQPEEEHQPSSVKPAEMSTAEQVQTEADPSDRNKESTMDQKDVVADLPGEGASVLYCVLPERSDHSVASTSSRQEIDSTEPPAEGDGDLFCLLPPRNGNSGRSSNDSKRSSSGHKDDGDLFCRLSKNGGHSGGSSGGSKRSVGVRSVFRAIRRSSSFSSDIPLSFETSADKRDGSVSMGATERSSSAVSTEPEDLQKETPTSSPMSLRRLIEGRSDRCRLRRRIFHHERTSSFEWAKVSMVQWAMRLPSRYSSVHPDNKSLKSDTSPRLRGDSECDSTSTAEPESIFSFSLYDVAWPPSELGSLQEEYSSVCRLFSYEELKLATSNFSPDMLIGKGGTSHVYKAQLNDGTLYAAKILKPSVDALQEFITEIETVTSLQNENIVSLRGFSFDNYFLVLVYDYMHQGSLDKALHGKCEHSLSWEKRNKIAIHIAKALEFLHHGGVTESVIHGDVKSANILLSEDFEAQLCDFGLAKKVSASTPHLTCTDITGTFGTWHLNIFRTGR